MLTTYILLTVGIQLLQLFTFCNPAALLDLHPNICDDVINNIEVAKQQPISLINKCWAEYHRRLKFDKDHKHQTCPDVDCSSSSKDCLLGWKTDDVTGCIVCECNKEGDIFQGDIVLTSQSIRYLRQNLQPPHHRRSKRAVTSYLPLWKLYRRGSYYVIPYVIDETIDEEGQDAIADAIADFRNFTCIRFEVRKDEDKYLKYANDGKGCFSSVGMAITTMPHVISLGKSCWSKGIVIHETLHSLGFWHEHSRPDRDNHVKIIYYNMADSLRHNFVKFPTNEIDSMTSPYDVTSVMQYSSYAFSRNGRPTMVSKATGKPFETQREGFSQEDINQVNRLYECPKTNHSPDLRQISYLHKHCHDEKTFCFNYAIDGANHCEHPKFAVACCASCRVATKLLTSLSVVASSLVCRKDKRIQCGYWKKMKMCETSVTFMKKFCCKTCSRPSYIDWDRVLS